MGSAGFTQPMDQGRIGIGMTWGFLYFRGAILAVPLRFGGSMLGWCWDDIQLISTRVVSEYLDLSVLGVPEY